MQIPRAFATCAMGLALSFCVPITRADSGGIKLKIENLPAGSIPTPVSVSIQAPDGAKTGELISSTNALLAIPVQIQPSSEGATAYWLMPANKNLPSEYTLTFDAPSSKPAADAFRFIDGDGFRDLVYGDQKITRGMIKWDPKDRANTFKPFTHVYAFNGDGFITKGPGGLYTHHRGIFFGFKTQYGDFWHCPDVHQEHEKYVADQEFTGPVVARAVATNLWIGKDNKPVVRDTRDVKTWRIAADQLVMDYDITVESLKGEINLGGDPHHAGFHFRADNEVAGADQKAGSTGKAKYVRPPQSTSRPNDFWDNENWVASLFTVRKQPYVVVHMDDSNNPRPIVYSTRSYGRFGSFFTGKVDEGKPLHLKYRLIVMDGAKGFDSPDHYAAMYHDFVSPVKVTIEGK